MWEVSGRKQYDGFWFANVCNVEIGYSYYFQVFNTDSGLACNRLSLGGREMSFFFSLLESSLYYGQETERNRISVPLSASAWTGFFFSSTIVYQVFLPVFTDPTDIDLCLRQLIVHLP